MTSRALALIIALVLVDPIQARESVETLPGYFWTEVTDGVYLHAPADPLAAPVDGNSVIIVRDNDVIVVDTHINPAAARAAIAHLRKVTDLPVTRIINTHWHDDHVNGNHAYRQAYPDAAIFAHQATIAALRREWPAMLEQRRSGYATAKPEAIRAAAEALDDPEKAWSYRTYAGYVAALKPELPTLQMVYPDTVFADLIEFRSGGQTVVVQWLGRGNTDGDAVVWLPENRILITGDLLVAPIPFAFDSPMADWIETLHRLRQFESKIIIPGHGPVQQDVNYLKRVLTLLETTLSEVRKAHDSGVAYETLSEHVDLSALETQFTGGDPALRHAWKAFFLTPGLKSAWASLGYEVPEE